MNTKIFLMIGFLPLALLMSCSEEKKEQQETPKVNVKIITLKQERVEEIKSFFGTLDFSKTTSFVAQQPGIVSKLNVKPGQKVKKGETIIVFPPINHQLQIEQAKIEQVKTQQDYNRQKRLQEAGAVSKVSVQDIKTQLDVQSKTVQQLQQVNIIRAPFNGIITQLNVNPGQEVGIGVPLFSMAQTSNSKVDFYVTPHDISDIHIGATVSMKVNDTILKGEITKKSIQADTRRKAFLVTATFKNNNIRFGGNSVEVYVTTNNHMPGIWLPSNALKQSGSKYYVFVSENQMAKKKIVSLGQRNEKEVQVINGLIQSDTLITAGSQKIEENTPIKIIN